MREVENASVRIAARRSNDEYAIAPSRLSDIETKGVVPSIFRLYTLAAIYRLDVREILSWYGIDLSQLVEDLALGLPPKSHRAEALPATATLIVVLPPIEPPLPLSITVDNKVALMLAAVTSIAAFPGLLFCTANAKVPFELRSPPASTVWLEKALRFVPI